ncbi:hypothetical protein Bca4012_084553 [Brassica carinata]
MQDEIKLIEAASPASVEAGQSGHVADQSTRRRNGKEKKETIRESHGRRRQKYQRTSASNGSIFHGIHDSFPYPSSFDQFGNGIIVCKIS